MTCIDLAEEGRWAVKGQIAKRPFPNLDYPGKETHTDVPSHQCSPLQTNMRWNN